MLMKDYFILKVTQIESERFEKSDFSENRRRRQIDIFGKSTVQDYGIDVRFNKRHL